MIDKITMKKETPLKITKKFVLDEALKMLNDEGIDAITTRRLATRLGIKSPSLYWHFKSKSDLLEGMAEAIMQTCHLVSFPTHDVIWQDWLIDNSISFRRALLSYRDGARLHAGTTPKLDNFEGINAQIIMLCEAGFNPTEAMMLLMSLGRFIVGWVLEEQQSVTQETKYMEIDIHYPLITEGTKGILAITDEELFKNSIKIFIAGAESLLNDKNNNL